MVSPLLDTTAVTLVDPTLHTHFFQTPDTSLSMAAGIVSVLKVPTCPRAPWALRPVTPGQAPAPLCTCRLGGSGFNVEKTPKSECGQSPRSLRWEESLSCFQKENRNF